MHEAGHSYHSRAQRGSLENASIKNKIVNSGEDNIVKFLWAESAAVERQTNAYGMTAARIAKEQGLDLTQIMNKESYDRAMQAYQNAVDIQNIPVDYLTERRRHSRAAEEKKRKAREAEADSQSGSGLLSKVKNVFKRRKQPSSNYQIYRKILWIS